MFDKLEDFFLNKLIGQLIVRAAVTAAAFAAGPAATAALGKAGLSVSIDPTQLATALQGLAHSALSVIRHLKAQDAPAAAPAPTK